MTVEIYINGILYTRHQLADIHTSNLASNQEEYLKKELLWADIVRFLKRRYRVGFGEGDSWEIVALVPSGTQPSQISEEEMIAFNSRVDRIIFEKAKAASLQKKSIKRNDEQGN